MASKLSNKQLKTREFVLEVFRKEAPATKTTLKKLMKVYSDIENKPVTEKYGERLISSFLSVYKFKSKNDYLEIMSIMKHAGVYDSGLTYYGNFHSMITKKLFDSDSIKTTWIISDIAENGSFAEVNNVVGFLMTREKENYAENFGQLLDGVKGLVKEPVVMEAIIRHAMGRKEKELVSIVEKVLETPLNLEIQSIKARYKDIQNKNMKIIIGNYLYYRTKDEEYLPDSAKDMFIF
jgi:hypothetical protein